MSRLDGRPFGAPAVPRTGWYASLRRGRLTLVLALCALWVLCAGCDHSSGRQRLALQVPGGTAKAAMPSPAAPAAPGSADPGPATGLRARSTVLSFRGGPPTGVATHLGPWDLVGRLEVLGPYSDQGLASVSGPSGTSLVFRGTLSTDSSLRRQGWVHVGDPDSWHGWVIDAFQGTPGARSKMFQVTSPGGAQVESVHPLDGGEQSANSFAAVSPDGRWTLSDGWGSETRLLVFPTPVLNTSAPAGRLLPLAGFVDLDRPVRDLQGCAFVDARRLVCATSDPGTDLWGAPDQLLQIDLASPLPGPSAPATVTYLGQAPMAGGCTGTYEPEGVDIDRSSEILRVDVAPPGICNAFDQIYEYRLPAG